MDNQPEKVPEETPAAKAERLAEKLRAVLKERLADRKSGDALLRWVRSDDDDAGQAPRR